MIDLRSYQRQAIESLYRYFGEKDGNPLVVLPTGTGKSIVIAEFCRGAIEAWPDTRIVLLTHVRELIAQNFAELTKLWPDAPGGIYSAGLNKRDLVAQIVFAGIQSIHRRAIDLQRVDLVLIDEAHLVPRKSSTMYLQFLKELKHLNPSVKIIGFTATPYRMDSGLLHEGDGAIFTDIAFEYSVMKAIDEGYLSPVVPKEDVTRLDVSGVGSRGGEFIQGQLEAAVDTDGTNRAIVKEIVDLGADRGSWIVFCAGVSHASHLRDLMRAAGVSCEMVSGETPTPERDRMLRDFKTGRIRCLTNANILTTGFNAPGVDLIAMARPTKSVGLYVQTIGRGTRLANGKENCLVLDFAGNIARHGPLDQVEVRRKTKSGDAKTAPTKQCPECDASLALNTRACPVCGHLFGDGEACGPNIDWTASTDPLLSSQIRPSWIEVSQVHYGLHQKAGKPPSLKVTYSCNLLAYSEWVCFQHTGYPREKACAWWRGMGGGDAPSTVAEALARTSELRKPARILIKRTGKYIEITKYDFTPIQRESAA